MQSKLFAGAAVLLALANTALAGIGSAVVVNNCDYPIYYASVGQGYSSDMKKIEGNYTETYSQPNAGVSIKLAPEESLSGPISQFEFTWWNGMIAYDLSNINGYPFSEGGMSVVPSTKKHSAFPSCVPITCAAGEALCTAAYNAPDDVRTMVCSDEVDLVLTMCPDTTDDSDDSNEKRSETFSGDIHYRVHPRYFPTK